MSADYLSQSLNDILSIARLAPSVHNTQPWKVKVEPDGLKVMLDRRRLLDHGDPTGRESYISLGIFTEACVIGLENCGFKLAAAELKDDEVLLRTEKQSAADNSADVEALKNRFTDRTVFKKADFSSQAIAQLNSGWHTENVEVVATSDLAIIGQTAQLTRQALLLAFSNPAFRQELTDFFVDKPSVPYGIPLSTLGTSRLKARFVRKLINSGVNRKQEANLEYKRWSSASGLVFVLASGDSKPYWLESGRAYLRASLEIQKLGLSQATSAAVVEAADFHEDIERLLGTQKRIQCVMRVGRGSKKLRPSGRLSPQQLIAT
jgi:hypothetical protein